MTDTSSQVTLVNRDAMALHNDRVRNVLDPRYTGIGLNPKSGTIVRLRNLPGPSHQTELQTYVSCFVPSTSHGTVRGVDYSFDEGVTDLYTSV